MPQGVYQGAHWGVIQGEFQGVGIQGAGIRDVVIQGVGIQGVVIQGVVIQGVVILGGRLDVDRGAVLLQPGVCSAGISHIPRSPWHGIEKHQQE